MNGVPRRSPLMNGSIDCSVDASLRWIEDGRSSPHGQLPFGVLTSRFFALRLGSSTGLD